jgi:hypothetical protein
MTLKVVLAAVAAAAIAVGFCLPATLHREAEPKSQIQQLEVGRG